MDRNDPMYSNDPTLPPNERTPGWEPVVGTTYEPQDERTVDHEHDVEHVEHVDHDTSATHEHVEGEDVTGYDKDTTGYDRR